jgi:arylsulfatase A-like enzyme
MQIRLLIYCLLVLTVFSCGKDQNIDPEDSDAKPNILLIIADDIGVDAFPGYNLGEIKPDMPNLEELSSQGITFDNVWANPVCAPTRASILTGRYGYRTGVLNAESSSTISADETSIQEFLDENTNSAYSSAVIGKWHLSNNANRINQLNIDYFAGLLGGGVGDYYDWPFTENGETENNTAYTTTKFTDLAIDWINQQDSSWFCWLAYNSAHTPFHLPSSEMHSQGNIPSDQASIDDNPIPYYMAMIESIDFEIGRLLENIPPDELENTTIIFIGDNGTPRQVVQAPYTKKSSKGSLYQGGVHVPMFVTGAGVARSGQRETQLINSADLFATLAEIAGVNLSSYEDSKSFYSLLSSNTIGKREYNYSEILGDTPDNSGFTIRNDQYKLIQFDNGEQELYDLFEDPYEASNLLDNPLQENQSSALQELINEALIIRS